MTLSGTVRAPCRSPCASKSSRPSLRSVPSAAATWPWGRLRMSLRSARALVKSRWLDKGKAPFSSVAEPTELPDYRGSTRNANQNGGNRE